MTYNWSFADSNTAGKNVFLLGISALAKRNTGKKQYIQNVVNEHSFKNAYRTFLYFYTFKETFLELLKHENVLAFSFS